ncbi:proteasome alpha-4 subunit [Micromonas pusilla CCMP1545]|uniref:Proteasome subunit alpha type n=1 Tax=Micromonas pusilla (strain CCMP1545) TaxID=564608 RepID=C1MKX7_MICPC|nr:proteasome alpha-4 subunit [Micromonas pusilla CCMP1545]EEH59838.1 proteasome alpha-4 subunit [Micromonas pusilla CCMP1545]|eukprot:XP_003056462.1 proteasome alpha-4 subunit [Micromonas pusilla CCMP1545]
MARRYDSHTTTFSPDGRLFQVEYAMEAISHAGAAVGIRTDFGVVLAAEKKILSKLLETSEASEKMFKLDANIAVAVAGINSDANILINSSRLFAQRYALNYSEQVPVEHLVQSMCDQKQGYTQFGGLRPFGVSFLFGGWDRNFGFQLYQSDPSGNYSGWKATAVGANSQAAHSILKTEYVEGISLSTAKQLSLKVLKQTMDSTILIPDKVELSELAWQDGVPGQVSYRLVRGVELRDLCIAVNRENM